MTVARTSRIRLTPRRANKIDAATHRTAATIFGAGIADKQSASAELAVAPARFTNRALFDAGTARAPHHSPRANAVCAKQVFGTVANSTIVRTRFIDVALRFTLTP